MDVSEIINDLVKEVKGLFAKYNWERLESNEILSLIAITIAILYPFALFISTYHREKKARGVHKISSIYIYPIKSCRRVSLQKAR